MTEKTFIIPLRKEFQKAPLYKRSKKAMTAVQQYLAKHLKADFVIGPKLNMEVWKDGIKNPPSKVKVTAIEKKEGWQVELFGHKYPEPIVAAEKTPEGLKEKVQAALKKDEKGAAEKTGEGKKESESQPLSQKASSSPPSSQKKSDSKNVEKEQKTETTEKPAKKTEDESKSKGDAKKSKAEKPKEAPKESKAEPKEKAEE